MPGLIPPDNPHDAAERRSDIRRALRTRRAAFSADVVRAASLELVDQLHGLAPICEAKAIAGYVAIRGELDVTAILEAAHKRGGTVALPRLTAGGAPQRIDMTVVRWEPSEPLVTGPFGIAQAPDDGRIPLSADSFDVVLAPAVAVDRRGTRLGMGRGFYDRWLSTAVGGAPPLVVAVVYDFQVVDELERQPWDRPVHLVVTPTRVLYCTP